MNLIKILPSALKDVFSFLKTGEVPSNTPVEHIDQLKSINHLSSKKFYIVTTSFVALCFFYFVSVGILFLLPQHTELIGGYVTIFTKTIEVLAIIIASYLGVQAVVDFKYNSSSQLTTQATASNEEKTIIEMTERYRTMYSSDSSYAPLDWIKSYEDR